MLALLHFCPRLRQSFLGTRRSNCGVPVAANRSPCVRTVCCNMFFPCSTTHIQDVNPSVLKCRASNTFLVEPKRWPSKTRSLSTCRCSLTVSV
jgi:hypothetical protein